MCTDADKALAQLVRDYQAGCETLATLEHAVHKQAEGIQDVAGKVLESPGSVEAVDSGFTIPIMLVGGARTVSFDDISIQTLHDDLKAMSLAKSNHDRLANCMRKANLGNLVKE